MSGRRAGAHHLRWCNEIYLTIVVRQNKMAIWYHWYDKSSLQQRPQVCLTGCCIHQNKRDTDDLRPLRRCVELCHMFLQRPLSSCISSLGLTGGYKRNGMEYGERNQVSIIITLAVHSYWVWPSIKSSYILQGSQDDLIFTNPPYILLRFYNPFTIYRHGHPVSNSARAGASFLWIAGLHSGHSRSESQHSKATIRSGAHHSWVGLRSWDRRSTCSNWHAVIAASSRNVSIVSSSCVCRWSLTSTTGGWWLYDLSMRSSIPGRERNHSSQVSKSWVLYRWRGTRCGPLQVDLMVQSFSLQRQLCSVSFLMQISGMDSTEYLL